MSIDLTSPIFSDETAAREQFEAHGGRTVLCARIAARRENVYR